MITVNLTTTLQRLEVCRISLASILMQSRMPDRINLWVSAAPYLLDKGISDGELLQTLIESIPVKDRDRIAVRWVDNTGPYRKLIPALREASEDDVVITADDDIFYGRSWIEKMLDASERFPNEVIAPRVRQVKRNAWGGAISYLYWPIVRKPVCMESDFAVTFGGGAVLSRSFFREADIHNDDYLSVAPTSDDLWFSRLLQLKGARVRVLPSLLDDIFMVEIEGGLKMDNLARGYSLFHRVVIRIRNKVAGYFGIPVCGNDHALRAIDTYFKSAD